MTKLRMSRRAWLAAGATGAGTLTATMMPSASASQTAPRVLRIGHLTDTHLQPERGGAQGFSAALNHVQSLPDAPSLLIFGGDNLMGVDSPQGSARADTQVDLWKRVLAQENGLPALAVIGNHDVRDLHPSDGKQWAADHFGMPHRYHYHDAGGWRLILLDSTMPKEAGYRAELDEEQFDWLARTLRDTPATMPVCIVTHIPIVSACAFFDTKPDDEANWRIPGSWSHVDARRIKDLFVQHPNVTLCLSGHMHLADQVQYLGVTYACSGAVSGAWWGGAYHEFEPAYAVVDLYADGSSQVRMQPYGWQAQTV